MRTFAAAAALLMTLVTSGSAQQGGFTTPTDGSPEAAKLAAQYDPTKATYITAADIEAAIGRLPDRASANGVFVERSDPSSITGLAYRLQIDRRRLPQNANAHRTEAEVWAIVQGSGTVTTGGKVVETRRDGKVVSRAIEGGESRKVAKGDFIMIPEGVPHYVTEASPELAFMAIEFPRPRAAQMPPAPAPTN
jgi:mannose-6-phosphate isomerase-like protein (cupin superfamily)